MYEDVIIAGFGGQGVMLIGNILAYAAMEQNLNVTYMPVYGVEMRGGTANCTVVISDEEIGSPIIYHPRTLIVMNEPSLVKFQPRLVQGGVLVVNSSIVEEKLVNSKEYNAILVPVNDIADKLGNIKMANMVAMGVWTGAVQIMEPSIIENTIEKQLSSFDKKMVQKNKEAFYRGYEIGQKYI